MKKTILVMLLTLLWLFTACEFNKDFMVTLQKDFTVHYNGTSYAQTGDVNGNDFSDDFKKYRDDLKSLEIVKLTYIISNFTGSATQKINSATLEVGDPAGSALTNLASLSNVLLAAVAGKEEEIVVDAKGENKLEDLLLGDESKARLVFSGTANEAPVKFTIKFKIQCKVKYEKKLF